MFTSFYKALCVVILSFILVACKDDGSSNTPVTVADPVIPASQQDVITPYVPEPVPVIINEPAPPVKDRMATLTWNAPFTRTNGDSISMGEIQGYIVRYSQDIEDMDKKAIVSNDGLGSSGVVIDGLADGMWYFTVQTEDTAGLVSKPSDTVNKHI